MDRRVWLVVLLAFGLRLAMLAFVGDATGFRQAEHTVRGVAWDWGYEQGAIAQAIADGRGFADPFLRGSGPTAWATPLYPLLVAALLKVFGGVVYPTAVALAVLQALAAALVPWWLWRLGRATHSAAVGWLAAVLFALHPIAVYLPVTLVWDSTFVALGVTWFLARVAEEGPRASAMVVLRCGAMLGLVALVNPAPLALVPAALWYWLRPRDGAARARVAAAFFAGLLLVAGPWAVRNLVVLGSPNLRTNLGVELFVGNNDDARGPFNGRIHPAYDEREYTRYLELGEVPYAADAGARAIAWMRANPGRFARLSVERVQRFWVGPDPFAPLVLGSGAERRRDWQGWVEWLCHAFIGVCGIAGAVAFRGRDGAAALVRGALIFFPLVYYVTHVFERYRFPIEPVLVLAASALLVKLLPARWRGSAALPGAAAPVV